MYWMYKKHDVLPSVFYEMGPGERVICRAFMMKEIEDQKEAAKRAAERG